ncbi:MAG: hypothetical protein A2Z27_02055 [candidate division Zixibacteria bacterium RBG_16_50_21]|nr:MAG: hypothetical protein A2Z27_02055 [candidate division Zixibacteria bacterium RBG_16_50_21]
MSMKYDSPLKVFTAILVQLILLTSAGFAGSQVEENRALQSQDKISSSQPSPPAESLAVKASQKKQELMEKSKSPPDTSSSTTVIAYYFHNTHRCRTCLAIERNARDAIQRNFSKEIASGRLKFQPLNMEEKENQHFIKEYQLYSSSLILVRFRNGKQEKWENLQQVWLLVRDVEKFYDYVQKQVARFLEEKS